MKYTILINQKVLSKTKLDLKDAAILEYIRGWCQSDDPKIKQLTLREDGIDYKYTWINFNYLIEEMPLLYLKGKASVSERIERIKKEGFIKTFQSPENSLYVRLMPKIKELEFERGAVRESEQGVRPAEQGVFGNPNSTNSILINQNTDSDSAKKPNTDVPDSSIKEISYEYEDKPIPTGKAKEAKELVDWYGKVSRETFGGDPRLSYVERGYMIVIKLLKKYTQKELKDILTWYLETDKFNKFPQISAALSADTLRLYSKDNDKSDLIYDKPRRSA